MSDLPSVPSLKNLVHTSVFGSNSVKVKPQKASIEKNAGGIQRNFSTKSFLKFQRDEEEPPLRKCETVIALSAMSTTSSTASASQKKPKKPSSPLSVFKHLSNKASTTKVPDSGSSQTGATCESPYPVSYL